MPSLSHNQQCWRTVHSNSTLFNNQPVCGQRVLGLTPLVFVVIAIAALIIFTGHIPFLSLVSKHRNHLHLSLRFNGHFPGESGLAGVCWSKRWCKWWWQLELQDYKAPVKLSPPTNQHPVFYMLDALPVTQLTVSKQWRKNITFHGLAYPKLTWGLPTLSLTTNSSWLPWGRVAMPLISPLMSVLHEITCM